MKVRFLWAVMLTALISTFAFYRINSTDHHDRVLSDIKTFIKLDAKDRPEIIYTYFESPTGAVIFHGDHVEYNWLFRQRDVITYSHGDILKYSSTPVDSN